MRHTWVGGAGDMDQAAIDAWLTEVRGLGTAEVTVEAGVVTATVECESSAVVGRQLHLYTLRQLRLRNQPDGQPIRHRVEPLASPAPEPAVVALRGPDGGPRLVTVEELKTMLGLR
jgi:hypothetical protein